MRDVLLGAVALSVCLDSTAHGAESTAAPGTAALDVAAVRAAEPAAAESTPTPSEGAGEGLGGGRPFGAEGSWSLSLGAGASFGGVDASGYYDGFVSIDTFVVERFQIGVELGGWFFDQDEDDAVGGTAILNFRWHFLWEEDWSVYALVGVGLFGASDDVPEGGSEFGFGPRAGAGFTLRLGEGPERLTGGVMWQHFSNARTYGSDDNPGTDAVRFYLGVTIPF